MFDWLKSLISRGRGPSNQQRIFHFSPEKDNLLTPSVAVEEDAWCAHVNGDETTIRLFEIPDPSVDHCILTFRAKMRAMDAEKRAYLEMWCRIPNKGEFFSKGFFNAISGTTEWDSFEIPFYLRRDQGPDLIKLNIVMEGAGTIYFKDVEVFKMPLPS